MLISMFLKLLLCVLLLCLFVMTAFVPKKVVLTSNCPYSTV